MPCKEEEDRRSTGVPSIVRSRVRLSERNPKEMIKRELRLSKAFRQGNKLIKNAFINLSPILSTIVPNVWYIRPQRSVQCSTILSLFFRKCSFCLLLPYLELWHSAVSTMLLVKGCSYTWKIFKLFDILIASSYLCHCLTPIASFMGVERARVQGFTSFLSLTGAEKYGKQHT